MMCPDLGTWRRWIDEPSDELTAHAAACAACRSLVASLREDAATAAAAIDQLEAAAVAPATVRLARGRLAEAMASPRPIESAGVRPGLLRRWRWAGAGIAAAVVVGVFAAMPGAQGVAAQFLAQFRSERFVAVQLNPNEGRELFSHWKELGTVQEPERRRPERVDSLAEASARVGFAVTAPDPATLPAGLDPNPVYQVQQASDLRLTIEKAKVQEYLRRVGQPNHPFPEKLDGATLVVSVPAAVMIGYRDAQADRALVVGQAGEITAGVEGNATLDELRDYLLGLPGLPPAAVQQLRAIQDWRTTLPIPVPIDEATWQSTTVNGAPGLMLADGTGLGSGVIWQRDGRIHGVAGRYPSADILRVANGIR